MKITPSRTQKGYEAQRVNYTPVSDHDFNPSDYSIVRQHRKGWCVTNLPSWSHFDRVIVLGFVNGLVRVIGVTGKKKCIVDCKLK